MWHWIKHWLDWARIDVLPLSRTRPHSQAVHTRYEKAGLALYELPVPWNADAVVVEVLLRLPVAARRKTDYTLRLPGGDAILPESLRLETEDRHRILFRLPVPSTSATGELLWKQRLLAHVAVPILTASEFLASLRVALPTACVRLGGQTVAAQTFVAAQCKGMFASIVLSSPTPLAPIADLGLRAVFHSERSSSTHDVAVTLSSTQLAAKEAVITAVPPKHPRRTGTWTVSWWIANREVTMQRIYGIPARRFEQSLRVSDTRFVVVDKVGGVKVVKQPPTVNELARLGPCFLVASSELGMAGLCRFQVHTMQSGESRPPMLLEQEVLVTDGPTVFAPGMLDVADLVNVTGFELRHKGRVLGVASLSPVPSATFNAEGGFNAPADFTWSGAAEDELSERLTRLMNGGN